MINKDRMLVPLIPGTKTAMIKWKDGGQSMDTIDEYTDAAIIVPSGYIVVDVDYHKTIAEVDETLARLKVTPYTYNTTRGKHYLFKANINYQSICKMGSNTSASIFQGVDIRAAGKAIVQIKKDGVMRAPLDEIINGLENAPECPSVFYIKSSWKIRLSEYIANGRDSTAFAWVAKLRSKKWENDMITQFLVDTAITAGDPESYQETVNWAETKLNSSISMGTVVDYTGNDSEDFLENFSYNDKLASLEHNPIFKINGIRNVAAIADHLINEYELCFSELDKQIWGNMDGQGMKPITQDFDFQVGRIIYSKHQNTESKVVGEVVKALKYTMPMKPLPTNEFLIHFLNCDFDLSKNQAVAHDNKFIKMNQIPFNLITEKELLTTHLEALKTMEYLFNGWASHDKQVYKELFEVIGIAMTKYMGLDKAFLLVGDAENGKSWFLTLVETILGTWNVSNEELGSLSSNTFSSAQLYSKLANINNDINDRAISDVSLFKRIVSGDTISAQYKNQDAFTFKPYATLILGANELPYLQEQGDSNGVDRRLKIITFLNKFKAGFKVHELKKKMLSKEVIECTIYFALQYTYEMLNRGQLTQSSKSQSRLNSYLEEINNVLKWYNELDIKDRPRSGHLIIHLWHKYKAWCEAYSYTYFGIVKFSKKLLKVIRNDGHHAYTDTRRIKGQQEDVLFIDNPE